MKYMLVTFGGNQEDWEGVAAWSDEDLHRICSRTHAGSELSEHATSMACAAALYRQRFSSASASA